MKLDSKVPAGPSAEVDQAPRRHQARQPRQQTEVRDHRRRGRLAASAAASLANWLPVKCIVYHDTPARHSVAAQGGINAAKNYQNDGDSVYGSSTTPSRAATIGPEANVHRLAEVSVKIIDQCVAQGVPFAANTAGSSPTVLWRRQVSRTFYAAARPASNSSSAPTPPSCEWSARAP